MHRRNRLLLIEAGAILVQCELFQWACFLDPECCYCSFCCPKNELDVVIFLVSGTIFGTVKSLTCLLTFSVFVNKN